MFPCRTLLIPALVAVLFAVGCLGTESSQFKTFVEVEDSASADAPLSPELASKEENQPVEVSLAPDPKPAENTLPVAVANPPVAVANPQPQAPNSEANGPREIKLLVPSRTFKKDRPNNALRLTFDDIDLLQILNMDPVVPTAAEYLPGWLKGLHEQRVVLRGWMYPSGSLTGIQSFLFTRDNGTCCFGPNAKIYDKIGVKLRAGESIKYIDNHPFDVAGKLMIEPYINPEGNLEMLYRLEDAHAILN